MSRTLIDECQDGNIDAVKHMITNGANIEMTSSNGRTPLYSASRWGHLEIVKVLIAGGGDVNKAEWYGRTPLYTASCNGHLKIVNVLIASGGDVNKADNEGKIPLFNASKYGHLEIVKVLIANKANFLCKNNDGETPLDVAKTDEIKQFIMNHPWYRRRSLLVTRPYDDHDTNKEHQLTPLGEIITSTKSNDPSSQDNLLFQMKIKIASFL